MTHRGMLHLRTQELLLIGSCCMAWSCAGTESLHVVDEHGAPIEGVLALSGTRQGVATPCIVASMTDDTGEATKVDLARVALFKDGYHPFIDGVDQPFAYMDAPFADRPDPRVMWSSHDTDPRHVHVTELECLRPAGDDGTRLESPSELPLAVDFFHEDRSFRVQALGGALIPSSRFYFAGASTKATHDRLRGVEALAFYVVADDGSPRFKVCLVDRHQMWTGIGSRRTDTLRWLWTEVDDLTTPVVLQLTDQERALHVDRIVDPRPGPSFRLDGDPDRIRAAVETQLAPLGIPERRQSWLERIDKGREVR